MGKVKQLTIDQDLRTYVANDIKVTRDVFIMSVALELYNCPEIKDIRGAIDILLNDDNCEELLCFGDKKYFSYVKTSFFSISTTEIDIEEERPLKRYKISYDISVVPLIISARHGQKWKRTSMTMEATSFRDAKERFKLHMDSIHHDRKYKKVDIDLDIDYIIGVDQGDPDGDH